ncbi:hypothetical protein C882_1440 [Caenispirillum salinarum AK4]|uniref:DUF2249 domain-containing protein n=1 Tax=Caenispirillum salinarum AK4 TaxID=1238182 RepID=K9GS81_9PROT|nr:DUF2249 domain-containing protein [Caenispirillum salinarum]EKV27594.1 hypothetical protein C882_1440 [Caenispirillum salinarum AK4]
MTPVDASAATTPPSWVADVEADPVATVDAADLLAQGGDPLSTVLAAATPVPAGRGLVVVAPFDPVPLRDLLATHGFENFSRPVGDGRYRVTFLRVGGCRESVASEPAAPAQPPKRKFWMDADGLHLDARGLSAPGPMIEILRFIDGGAHDQPLMVHVPQFPVHLIPELEERGWTWDLLDETPGHVILRLMPGDA